MFHLLLRVIAVIRRPRRPPARGFTTWMLCGGACTAVRAGIEVLTAAYVARVIGCGCSKGVRPFWSRRGAVGLPSTCVTFQKDLTPLEHPHPIDNGLRRTGAETAHLDARHAGALGRDPQLLIARRELETHVDSLGDLESAWEDMAKNPAHADTMKSLERFVVGGTDTWTVRTVLPLFEGD